MIRYIKVNGSVKLLSLRSDECYNYIKYMATQQTTVDYIVDQLSGNLNITTRKMFGEYALYCDGKVVGLICDDTLFIKITDAGRDFVGNNYKTGPPYPRAKPWMIIDDDMLEDHKWLFELVQITSNNLPEAKVKW